MTRFLRLTAFAIAVAGFVDPAITLSGVTRPRVAVLMEQPASPEVAEVHARLLRDLGAEYDIAPGLTSDAAAALAIGDSYPGEPLPESLLVATVTTAHAAASGPRITGVDAPREVPPATAIHLEVEVEENGAAGRATEIAATLAGLEVGSASHQWAAGEKRWRASIEAVPVGEPPYVIQVRLKADPTGASATEATATGGAAMEPAPVGSGFSRTFSETVADVVVDLRRTPIRVQFYEPRPSWATTFIRRALEADPRFQVASLSFTSRAVSVQTDGAVPLGDPRLDGMDVVVAGGLDRLSLADAASLQRYMREGGGALVLVPDQRIDAGPARDLILGHGSSSVRLQPDLHERLLEQPATLTVPSPAPPLQASELLVFGTPPPGSEVVARVPGDDAAVVVSLPRGDGRLLLSGAMDAWRYRAAGNGAFDRFWQATIAGLALAVPPPIAVRVDPPLLRPGERGDVRVRVRSRDMTAVSASFDAEPIRLLPEAEAGVYRGSFAAGATPRRSSVAIRVNQGPPETRTVLVRAEAHRIRPDAAPSLAMLSSSHRGIDVPPGRVAELERFIRGHVTVPRAPQTRHPMRSAWWIVPFSLCLSAEWWLRRRQGLR